MNESSGAFTKAVVARAFAPQIGLSPVSDNNPHFVHTLSIIGTASSSPKSPVTYVLGKLTLQPGVIFSLAPDRVVADNKGNHHGAVTSLIARLIKPNHASLSGSNRFWRQGVAGEVSGAMLASSPLLS